MKATEFRAHLTKDLIPFWNALKDEENGGFYGLADSMGTPDGAADKGGIYTSRILWFYSTAYLALKEEQLLKNAEHAFRFLSGSLIDGEHGGVFWSVSCRGKPADTTKHTYCQAFAIYALSAYYIAGGDENALKLAHRLFSLVEEKMSDDAGYLECFTRDLRPSSNEKLSGGGEDAGRTMNSYLHLLEAYTELYRAQPREDVGASLKRLLLHFRERIYDEEKGSCKVFFDLGFRSLADIESYGHNIEASWLIDRACRVLDDPEYAGRMAPVIDGLAKGALERGIDGTCGAMNNERDGDATDDRKVWWVQAEAVVGFLNAWQNHPEQEEYREAAERVWRFIQDHVIDGKTGEWNEFSPPPRPMPSAHPWKGPYHNGRMCLEAIRRLEENN